MAHENSGAAAPSAADILIAFLADRHATLEPDQAQGICAVLNLEGTKDLKSLAKPLRAALATHGITLQHTHALEALARMTGNSSWMRARLEPNNRESNYALLTVLEGELQTPQLYPSIGEAVTALLTKAVELISVRAEPAFCTLNRNTNAFVLEVNQVNGPWFSLQMLNLDRDKLAAGDIEAIPFEAETLRTALRKVVSNIEHARPAVLVVRGAIPAKLPPTYASTWLMTGMRANTQRMVTDERELFLFLDAAGCKNLRFERGSAMLPGVQEDYRLEQVWVDMAETGPAVKEQTPAEIEALFKRYSRFCEALPGSVAQMLTSVGGADKAGEWTTRFDFAAFESFLAEKQMTVRSISQSAGVPYRDVMRLRDYELAPPVLVARLAALLGVNPKRLQRGQEQTMGFSVDTSDQMLKMMSGAMGYTAVMGNSLTASDMSHARKLLDEVRDLSEMYAIANSEPYESAGDSELQAELHKNNLDASADALLSDIAKAGFKLILGREIQFMRSGAPDADDGGYLGMRILTLCIERTDGGVAAMWAPVRKANA
jgi:hypothetical protein